jgi:heme/copper-type cytochrome/quinol oxidase subunit 2
MIEKKITAFVKHILNFWDFIPYFTPMEGVHLLNLHFLFITTAIIFLVAWLLFTILINFSDTSTNRANFTYSSLVKITGASVFAFILLSLASPSLSLLHSLDEISNPKLTLKTLGNKWYGSYAISDFNFCSPNRNLKYSIYILNDQSIRENDFLKFFRNLETNHGFKPVALVAMESDQYHYLIMRKLGLPSDPVGYPQILTTSPAHNRGPEHINLDLVMQQAHDNAERAQLNQWSAKRDVVNTVKALRRAQQYNHGVPVDPAVMARLESDVYEAKQAELAANMEVSQTTEELNRLRESNPGAPKRTRRYF